MASVDGVGRKFPLLALSQPPEPDGIATDGASLTWTALDAAEDRIWYDAAEDVVLAALDEAGTLEAVFDQAVRSAAWLTVQARAADRGLARVRPRPDQDGSLWWAPALAAELDPIAFSGALPPPSFFSLLLTGSQAGARSPAGTLGTTAS